MEMPTGSRAAESIRSLAYDFERLHPELDGVFTKALLSGLERLDGSMLMSWSFQLSQISRLSVDSKLFGAWMNEKISALAMQTPNGGEATTPPSVARLMVELADLRSGVSVLDPCCGVGTVLAAAVARANEEELSISVFGQEISLCELGAVSASTIFVRTEKSVHCVAGFPPAASICREGAPSILRQSAV